MKQDITNKKSILPALGGIIDTEYDLLI